MSPFVFNPNQERRHRIISQQWDTEKRIRIIDLKARRVGVSAQTEAYLWCFGMAYALMNIKIVAHLSGASEELFRVPTDLSKAFPGIPSDDIQSKKLYLRHVEGDSTITMATAGTPSAGRGGTLSGLHLSEAAFYPSDDSFTAMISSVNKGQGSAIVIESTANGCEGPGEAFFEYWNDAVAGKNGYIPMFLSWLDDPACVRPEEEADDAPVDDLERELMAAPYHATKEQIAWMRRTKADDCRNLESKWLQDYPHSAAVAFQVTGSPAFARDELAYANSTVREPLDRGHFRRKRGSIEFEFIHDDNGAWFIWKRPFDSRGKSDALHYVTGADAASGMEDGDFAAAVILCSETGEIAARFADRVAPETLADQLDMSGRYFNRALVNIELTGNLGRWAQVKIRDVFRYPNLYMWKGKDDRKRGKNRSTSLGFEMTQATRRLIIDATRSMLRMGLKKEPGGLVVNDKALHGQMSLATLKEWRWDIEREHDDILVAAMIACLTREQYPPARMKLASKVLEEDNPKVQLAASIGAKSEMDTVLQREFAMFMAQAKRKQPRNRLVGI